MHTPHTSIPAHPRHLGGWLALGVSIYVLILVASIAWSGGF
ncbi:MAG: hypothetical protein ACRDQA_02855 [Nocardioidaceae bacterium]